MTKQSKGIGLVEAWEKECQNYRKECARQFGAVICDPPVENFLREQEARIDKEMKGCYSAGYEDAVKEVKDKWMPKPRLLSVFDCIRRMLMEKMDKEIAEHYSSKILKALGIEDKGE